MGEEERLVGTQEMARVSGYSPYHIRRLRSQGKIRGIRFGRQTWRFNVREVIADLKAYGERAANGEGAAQ